MREKRPLLRRVPISLITISLLVLFFSFPIRAQIYKYIDNKGVIHFTDRLESIPKEYRQQIKTIKEVPPQTFPPPTALGKEKSEDLEKETPPKIESPLQAEEKITPTDEKAKAREEKERQIAELRRQIEEKRKRQKSLWTNWMVYDRYTIVRLNQEIEALEKKIKALLKEMEEER